MIPSAVVKAFHDTAQLKRSDLFSNAVLTPITAPADAETAAPGWVGAEWNRGTLLVGINPGGGGDSYKRNPTDDLLYGALRTFRDAVGEEAQARAFRSESNIWSGLQQGHNIWRIIGPIANATGESVTQLAFMNILPFRTRMDAIAPAETLQTAWRLSAQPQIVALRPKRVIALGAKAWKILSRFDLPRDTELVQFKRGIGDSYIPIESQVVLAKLAAGSTETA
ncbi:hypothetical protein [Sphingomonas sp.]|jgi:hypothetical protein|uniref:hypothetical protein n=1 Tax=Sphingomonas sp. TaxID=28214 RepID=UPI002ED92B5B